MLALLSWLVPYDIIFNLLNQQSFITLSSEISEFNGALKQSIISNVNTKIFISPFKIFMLLTFVGFLLFIKDILSLERLLKVYSLKSIHFKKIKSVNIYEVKDTDNVFTAGLLSPNIYIGDKYCNSNTLPSIIQHELQHIKNKDQIWLLIITFIQKILWWNPIVFSLSKKARNYIELSCDEMCKNNSLDSSYQKGLIKILLEMHKSCNPLTSTFFGASKLNVYRIKQLSKEFTMKNTHKAMIFLTIITPFLLMPLVSTSSVFVGKTIYDENGEIYILNENQIDLEYSITVKIKSKDSSVDTRKIESRIIAEYGEVISYGRESDIFATSRFQSINPTNFILAITVKKVDKKSVMVNALVTFNNYGEKVELNPSIWVETGKNASLTLSGDNYDIELKVKPNF